MAAPSHAKEFEAVITRACSDPKYVHKTLPTNPILELRKREEELRYRMVPVYCEIDGYHMASDRSAELLVVYDSAGSIVGGVSRKSILVLPDYRGQGLGAEIVIRAFETGIMHPESMNKDNLLTAAGRANRIVAHRIAVERAVKAGIDVDPEVMSDYADELPKWTSGVARPRSTPDAHLG
jgi:GNAT superfamily N-acetyltransferase